MPPPLFKEPEWTQGEGEKKKKEVQGKHTRALTASLRLRSTLTWPGFSWQLFLLRAHTLICSPTLFLWSISLFFLCSSYTTWSLLQLLQHRQLQGQPMTKHLHYTQWQSSQHIYTVYIYFKSYYTRLLQYTILMIDYQYFFKQKYQTSLVQPLRYLLVFFIFYDIKQYENASLGFGVLFGLFLPFLGNND